MVKRNQALIQTSMESKKTTLELIPTKNQDKENRNKNFSSNKRPYSREKGVKEIPESRVIVILDSLETQDSLVSLETHLIVEDLNITYAMNMSKSFAIQLLTKWLKMRRDGRIQMLDVQDLLGAVEKMLETVPVRLKKVKLTSEPRRFVCSDLKKSSA